MQVDYLIIGQGISGTMLSWFLHKEGKRILVIDDNQEQASSHIAAGIINPVTGRRYAYTWMIEELMDFARQTYEDMGRYFDSRFIEQKSIIDFFPSPQMRNAFIERLEENDTYLHAFPDQNHFNRFFQYDFGCGEIRPSYIVSLQSLMRHWHKRLVETESLWVHSFVASDCTVHKDHIAYGDIRAEKIIFCEGAGGISNPWFQLLPFAPNKGEALIIESRGLSNEHVFKKGLMLVPMQEKDTFWVGSNYQWSFENDLPSSTFHDHASSVLNGWLKQPYRVLAHKAAVRPATLERRPFVGFHPVYNRVGMLNGMGTKGSSLAPFFAHQLVQNLVHGLPIAPEADLRRFTRILSK